MLRRDPTMFILGFAIWALITAGSILLTKDAFATVPIYAALDRLPFTEQQWAASLTFDAMLLAYSALCRRCWAKGPIALVSALLWLFFGIEIVGGAWESGIASGVGVWDICGSAFCSIAAMQWPRQGGAA